MTTHARSVGRRGVVVGAAAGVSSLLLPPAARASSAITPIPSYAGGSVDGTFTASLNDLTYRAIADGTDFLVVGAFTTVNGAARTSIARLDASGTLDTTFAPSFNNRILGAERQSDGRILVGGMFSTIDGESRSRIARLEPDGSIDDSFSASANGNVWDFAVESDGSIIVVGTFTTVNGVTRSRIARVSSSGSLDMDFDPNASGGSTNIYSVAVQDDGRILVGGNFTTIGGGSRVNIARLNTDGSLDTTFVPPLLNDYVSCVVLDGGAALVSGRFDIAGAGRLMRLTASGSLDTTFDVDANDFVWRVAAQGDGDIVLGGDVTRVNGITRTRLARVGPTGTVDADFDIAADDWVRDVLPLDDGSIIAVGQFTSMGGESHERIARIV